MSTMAENDNTKNFTITVRDVPNPKILIERKERSFIEVEKGTVCHWKVSAPGYRDQIGEVKVVSDINLTITLRKVPAKPSPHNSYMKVLPKRGNYVIDYKEIFKDTIPTTEDHEDEYLWTSHGYLWWKKLDIPKPEDFIVQELGDSTTVALSQKAITQFLNEKANREDVYTKELIDRLLSEKQDASEAVDGSNIENVACVMKGIENIPTGNKVLCNSYKFEVGTSAFSTIQEALNSNYKTIWIMSGVYNEDVTINNNGINLVGFGDSLIRGSISCNANNDLTLKNIKLLNESTDENSAALTINENFDELFLDNVDIICKGKATAFTNKRSLLDAKIIGSRFSSGLDNEGNVKNAFVLNNVQGVELAKNSIFGALDISGSISNFTMLENTLTVKDDSVLKFHDGKFLNHVDIYGNFAFSETIDSFITTKNINYGDASALNFIGNHVCFNEAFIKLLENNRNIKNEKASLSYNTANCASTAKFVIDTESDPARLTPDDGNIIATDSPVSMEQVDGIVRIERERAQLVEDRLEQEIREHVSNTNNPHNVTKEQLGLGNVDNTHDLDKPISTATQAALDTKLDSADLPTRLPNPTKLEIIFNNKFIAEYYGGEDTKEVIADIHFDINSSAEIAWALARIKYSEEQMVNFTTGGLFEKGEVLTNAIVKWNPVSVPNMKIYKQIYDGEEIPSDEHLKIVDSISSDYFPELYITYSAENGDKEIYRETVQSKASYKFVNKIYWGASDKEVLTNIDILSLDNELTDSIINLYTFDCTGGKYMYIVIPEELYDNKLEFYYANLLYTGWNSSTISLTNQHGYTTNYKLFRSCNRQTTDEIEISLR